MREFNAYLNEQLQDPEFKKEWDALAPEFARLQAEIDARNKPRTNAINEKYEVTAEA